jgi:hypothetical protein
VLPSITLKSPSCIPVGADNVEVAIFGNYKVAE